jgi:hypothetical protein
MQHEQEFSLGALAAGAGLILAGLTGHRHSKSPPVGRVYQDAPRIDTPMEPIPEAETPEFLASIMNPANLHVVAVFFNFQRFRNPVVNFHNFLAHMKTHGVTVHVVELVLGENAFQVTDPNNPHHIRLRTDTEFFQKENLINLGVKNLTRLYPDWKYMAWVDGDLTFFNENLAVETMYRLQRHPVVQMWTKAVDLGPDKIPVQPEPGSTKQVVVTSLCQAYSLNADTDVSSYGVYWHPGYAWAMRRSTYEAIGGLYEHAILGAADHHMAWAFIGKPGRGIHGAASDGYKTDARAWCDNAAEVVNGDLGCVSGLIHHSWHGRKGDRKYVERWSILVDNKYDPATDLQKDPNGLLRLTKRSPKLRDQVREYFAQRNDDANTLS